MDCRGSDCKELVHVKLAGASGVSGALGSAHGGLRSVTGKVAMGGALASCMKLAGLGLGLGLRGNRGGQLC